MHSLQFTAESSSNGILERDFTVGTVGEVPGVIWSPASRAADRAPLVLLAHGGGNHKKHPAMSGRAQLLVHGCGFHVAVIGPVGFWGINMGTAIGVPFVAVEPRITAAVFGQHWPDALAEKARRITVPVEFDMQWDDEHISRAEGLALFDAFASKEKSPHVNSGSHKELPRFEADSAVRFFARHLGGTVTASA
jgi:hypothetical protein